MNTPVTATYFNAANLVDSVWVYTFGSPDDIDGTPGAGTGQVTHYFFNRLGWKDSTETHGGRKVRYGAERDAYGNPVYEFPGNNTYVGRSFDWAGRIEYENPSQVDPNQVIVTGQTSASPPADSVFKHLELKPDSTLSTGQVNETSYDIKGRIAGTSSSHSSDAIVTHRMGYTRVGALIADTTTFRGGARVIRSFEYNRRGQRTLVRDTVMLMGTGTLSGDKASVTRHYYSTSTARMDSLVGSRGTSKTARVRFHYGRSGRDSVRYVRLGSGTGYALDSLKTRFAYDASGRIATIVDSSNSGIWHRFTSPTYNKADQLKSSQVRMPALSGGPVNAYDYTNTYTYDSIGGTWRLLSASKSVTGFDNHYVYDVYGNRTLSSYYQGSSPGCDLLGTDTSTYGPDNELIRTVRVENGCAGVRRYWHDGAGNRLVQLDTSNGGSYLGPQSIMTYTAKNELFFAMSWTIQIGTYDYNWHWYDGAGRRVMTQRTTAWAPPSGPSGATTYYVYDGSNVALTLIRSSGSTTWWTRARYLTRGTDEVIAGRFAPNGASTGRNLVLVADRQGTTLAAMDTAGAQEANAKYFSRDPYGGLPGTGGVEGTYNTETGLAGASQPNSMGGFTYLRNRWYDPQTGRFLTQDPVGILGGVNLYAYAGNNPVAYTDPFGLCPPQWLCDLIGASAGQSAVEHYAQVATDPSSSGTEKALATVGGLFAALWTPDTYLETASTLATGLAAAKAITIGREGAEQAGRQITKQVIQRPTPGRDGATSRHILERVGGRTNSVTHQVERNGKIIHQHQTHVGKYGTKRQFPDEWVEYPNIPQQ